MIKQVFDRAKRIKAVVFDGDGVIFTGHVIEGQDGPLAKQRCHADGQGISLLRSAGIRIACVTGEDGVHGSFLEQLVKKWNNLPSVLDGRWERITVFTGAVRDEKVRLIKKWLEAKNISLDECAAMGDDLTDYELMKAVGFAAAPAQAEDAIKKIAHYVAPRLGGYGAVRDLANFILQAKGINAETLAVR